MKRALHILFTIGLFLGATVAYAQPPVANFSATPLTSCSPLIVQFTDLSTDNPTSWSWNLGNGTSSTSQNPSTTYTVAGTYTVTLTVANASGSNTKTSTNYITVSPAPSVNFVVNDSSAGCGTKTVTVTNLSTPNTAGTAIYYWDFGDGFTSSAQNPPTHTYTNSGTYNISLVVTNSMGCTQAKVKTGYISVLPKPVAAFTASNTNACAAPVTTTFNNTSVGATSYAWDFGDGATATTASPSHTYTAAGSYTVRLITTSAGGCKDTLTQTALVSVGSITAGFTSNVSTTCTRNPVSFTNTSLPGGAGSTWYFGDGTTSTQINPVHAYTTAGTYTVKLVVAYSTCSDSATHTITVSPGPISAFTGSPVAGCSVPLTVSFSNTTSGAVSYLWLFGDGSTSTSASPSHIYSALGTYTVKLISTSANGCTDTVTRTNYIVIDTSRATLNINPFLGCAPAIAAFSATVTSVIPVASYAWTFGDGGTGTGGPGINHTYLTPGTYTATVTMTTTTGCVFTATQTVIAGSHTTPAFTATPTTVCLRTAVSFNNTTTGGATSYLWLFGDGGTSTLVSPTYKYGAAGIFNVTLITSNYGCADTLVRTNYVTVNLPKADFTSTYSCANRKQFTFANTSVGATSYIWSFGDGGTDTAANPVHTYAAFGTYSVRLIATSSVTGCTDTMVKPVVVSDLVAVLPPIGGGCEGSYINFTTTAGYASYFWDFGDGTSGLFSSTPAHQYLASGSYTVKLVVRDAQNCADSITRANYVSIVAPTASFTQSTTGGCGALAVTFSDNSIAVPGLPISSRLWNFGDGTTLNTTATSVTHTYVTAGIYSVTLKVTDIAGCNNTVVHSNVITINRPVAAFSSPNVLSCKNGVVSFANTSTGSGTVTYRWDFGDGGTSTAINPTHVYATVGIYTVRLIATEAGGCTDTNLKLNYINVSSVQSGFTMSDSVAPCPPFTVSFTNTSAGASSYLWVFGNGGTSTLTNPSAAFITSGTFTVKLIAINANGCRDTSTRNLVVGVGPSGSFTYTPTSGCSPLSMVFSATASGHTSLTYDFGNGITNTTTATTINYTYSLAGIFRPTLIISNVNGCNTFVMGPDTIAVSKATAGFSISSVASVCLGIPVQFNDTSSSVTTALNTHSWSFGDGGTSTATNPTHTYSTAGTYSVRLIVSTTSGCLDTTFRSITVNPLPVVVAANQTICNGSSVQLAASGAATYSWSPATGLSCTTCASPFASPSSTTTYTITGTSATGCVNTGTATVTVNPVPVVSAGSPVAICSGLSTTLSATGGTTYSWSPSTGLSCTACASPSASPTATTTYTVIGTTNGCSDTDNVTVTVNPVPVVTTTPSQPICAGSSLALTASGATTYSWSPSTGLSCSTCASPTASPAATTTYTVTGTTNGCSATASTTITVTPIPVVSVAGNNAICNGTSATLTASGATAYAWSPSTGLSCTTCASPIASPAATTTYTVTGTTSGCTGSATFTLTVNPLPAVNAGPDAAICAGASTNLSASGAATYSWSPATGLSCTTCAAPTASPVATTSYVVTGADANGCGKADTVLITVNPLPVVSAGGNTSICPGGTAALTATGAASYVWSPATGLSCTACTSTVASPSVTTIYKVVGTSALGCKDSANVTVAVNTTPTVTVSGTLAVCAGFTTTLTASGANAYSWSPATGLSCTTCASPVVTPTATTTYTVTGTSGIGCTGTTTVTVTVNPLPSVSASRDTAICIGASATLTASGATSYAWSPAAGLSCTTCASPIASPTATTTYTVTGTNSNGCIDTGIVTITVNPLPVVSAGSNTSICPGGSATLTATGAATYVWTPSTGLSCTTCASPTASPAATATYTVTGTSAAGCTNTSTVTVAVNATPVVSVTGTNAICIGGNTSLTASGANFFTWTPAAGLSCTSCANPTANPTVTTTYTVVGTSGVGCTGTTTFMVTVNPLPVVNAGRDTSICAGSSATLTASGATSYAWSPAAGLSCTTCASPVASPTATTTYVVTGTSTAGCVKTDTIIVTVNPLPVVSAGSNTSVCPGGTATLTATGAAAYVWSPGTTLSCTACASTTATPSATTTYKVVGTSALGCKDSANVTVAVNGVPVVTISGTNAICIGGTTSLTASGANSFTWSPAAGLSCTTCANPTATPTVTTTYTVVGTSGVGCTGTTTFTVTVNPLPVVNAGPDATVCVGAAATLTASGATSYAWSPSTGLSCSTCASPVASPAATTTYVVTGTNANGCMNTDTVVVTVNPLPIVSAGSNTSVCPGGTATLTATGAAAYVWSPAATLSCTACAVTTATPSATTIYKVVGTSALGCKDSATVTVAVNGVPVVSVTGTNAICIGGNTSLTASGANFFTWTPATGLSCTSCANPTANPTVTTTYTVVGTSGVGCTGTTTFMVTVNPLPVVNAGRDTAICAGSSATLTASGAMSYAWSPAAGLSCTTCASPVASPTATTTYVVTGTSTAGCVKTDTIIVTVNPLPVVSAGSNTSVCPGGTATLTATGAAAYVWSPGATLSCTACASTIATPSATTTYTVTGTSIDGCVNTAAVTVSVNTTPVVTVTGNSAICIGGSTTLTAAGANSFSWSPATGLSCTTCANPTANPTTTTTYTVIGTSGVGCSASTTFTLAVNPLPTVSAGPDAAICAGATTTLTASGATTYAWSPSTGLSATTGTSVTANPTTTTAYIVTGTNGNGCSNTDTVIVTVNPLPALGTNGNTSVCPGGSAPLTVTGAASYVWSPGATLSCTTCANPVATPSVTTTYAVTGTNAAGCSSTASVTVSVNQTPAVTVTGAGNICIGNSTTLTASGANNFSWSPATGLSCTSCANPTANPTTTTTYTVVGTSGVGCTGTTTFTLVVNPLPVVSAGADVAICSGTSTTLTATGATTYAWSPSTGLSATTGTSVTANPTATTTYTVTGTNSNGCVNTANVTVTVNPLPTVSAGANTAICPGGSATLTATGGATYLWTPSTGLSCTTCASPTASPVTTTTYTVTGTTADGCSRSSTVTVSVNQVPVITVAGTNTICAGNSTTLTASGANSFTWSPATGLSSATGATVTANPATTSTYTVTGTSGVGCTGTTTVTITVNPLPVVSAGADIAICAGTSTTLTATGAASYVWTPATGLSTTTNSSTVATPAATTTYTVTGTSAAGCTGSANVTVTINAPPVVSAGNNTGICPGGSATLTATGAATYVWTPAATLSCTACASPVATPSVTTTYTVVGTGSNGCNSSSTVTVTVNQQPTVAISGNTSVCAGTTTVLTASGASSYSWSPAATLSCATCISPTASPAATTTYTVTGTSGVGCVGMATVTVTVHPLPVITVDTAQTLCLNTPVQLTASGASAYTWTPAAGLSCTSCANPVATPSATTTYTVTGTDGFGCADSAQTTLTILPLPPVNAGPDVSSCKLNSVVLTATGAASYVWSPATGLSCTTCDTPTATPVTSTTYVVTGTGTNGCTAKDSVNVSLYPNPPVNAGPDKTVCSGSSVQLLATGADKYVWTPATDLSCTTCADPLSTPANTITYMVSGTDINGCSDSDLVTISVIHRRPVTIDTGGDFCVGGSIQLLATGGDSYTWSPAGSLSCTECAAPTARPIVTTTYSVIIRQSACFADTLNTTVVVHPLPTVNAGPDQSIVLGSMAQINATGTDISEYTWTPSDGLSCNNCPNPVASPAVNTSYVVTVTSEFGCTASDDIKIAVRCEGTQIWMPNTFTPNADGQNDFFYPHGKGISNITRFRIYDRWGELLYDRTNMPLNDRSNGWDGTYKNQALKPDVYVWILNAICTNGDPLEQKGDISLVR